MKYFISVQVSKLFEELIARFLAILFLVKNQSSPLANAFVCTSFPNDNLEPLKPEGAIGYFVFLFDLVSHCELMLVFDACELLYSLATFIYASGSNAQMCNNTLSHLLSKWVENVLN